MDKQIMVYLYNRILFSTEKKCTLKLKRYGKYNTKWKKTICIGFILYDPKYMTFWKKQNYGDKISGCQQFRGRLRWNGQIAEEFQGNKTISSVHSLSQVRLFVTPWNTARQASPSITNSWSLEKLYLQWNYNVWYENYEHMSLYICQNLWNTQNQE